MKETVRKPIQNRLLALRLLLENHREQESTTLFTVVVEEGGIEPYLELLREHGFTPIIATKKDWRAAWDLLREAQAYLHGSKSVSLSHADGPYGIVVTREDLSAIFRADNAAQAMWRRDRAYTEHTI